MQIAVCAAHQVPFLQREGITKILSLIEPNFPMQYQDINNCRVTRLNILDAGTDVSVPRDHYLAPNEKHLRDIIEFADSLVENDKVVIHCYAGKSRSTAAAMIVLYRLFGDFDQVRDMLLRIRPIATPNRYLCELADNHFNTNGQFLKIAEEFWAKNAQNSDGNFFHVGALLFQTPQLYIDR